MSLLFYQKNTKIIFIIELKKQVIDIDIFGIILCKLNY